MGSPRQPGTITGGELAEVAAALARRPGLWAAAAVAVLASARPGWWRSWPPVPAPDPAWMAFRLECATGRGDGRLAAEDVVAWLEWWRRSPRRSRYSRRRWTIH